MTTPRAKTTAIPSLDGIRAISFLMVYAAHSGLDRIVPGGLGVTIFFFLSGYLITTLLRNEFDASGHVNLRHFWLRRALRILPPFYLFLALAIAVALLLQPAGTVSLRACLWQALHVGNYWTILHTNEHIAPGSNVYWSLAVEEHFYLLFPWLFIAMRRAGLQGRNQALLLWTLCAALLAWRWILMVHLNASDDRTHIATDTRVDSILFGCALAVWRNPALDEDGARSAAACRWLLPTGIAIMLLCLLYRDPVFRETFRYSLQGVSLTLLFYCAVRCWDRAPFAWLNAAPVAFIGTLSYSLYLVHNIVLLNLSAHVPALGPVATPLLGLVITGAVSWLSYRFVEQPCARLRRRLTDVRFSHAAPHSG